VLDQRGQPAVAVAGVVVDDGQPARALRDQGIDQRVGHAGGTEAADHHRCAIVDIGHRCVSAGHGLVDHCIAPCHALRCAATCGKTLEVTMVRSALRTVNPIFGHLIR